MGVYLSEPKRDKVTVIGQGNGFVYAASSMQGWRTSMEDADICCPNLDGGIQLYGVFDGHGGQEVSAFVEKNFSEQLLKNEAFSKGDYAKALTENFMKMDELLRSQEGKAQLQELMKDKSKSDSSAGCTANVALIHQNVLYVANAGDSRTLLCQNGTPIRLSEDHKPDNVLEYARIREAGGDVTNGRVNGNLNLSRALGDLQYKKDFDIPQDKQLIIALPDVKVHNITPEDEFILIGCDGVWETLSDEEIVFYIRQQIGLGTPCNQIVETLLDKLLSPDQLSGSGCDNMTCILVTLQDYDVLKSKYANIGKEFSPSSEQNTHDESNHDDNNSDAQDKNDTNKDQDAPHDDNDNAGDKN